MTALRRRRRAVPGKAFPGLAAVLALACGAQHGTSRGDLASGGSGARGGGGTSDAGQHDASGGGSGGASSGGASGDGVVDAAPGADASPPADAGTATAPGRVCPGGPMPADPLPVERAARLVLGGFGFTEGPVWVASVGRLFFSDMDFSGGDAKGPPSAIRYVDVLQGGTAGTLVASSGSNGLALSNDGRLLAAVHDTQSLAYFAPGTGARGDWPLSYQGHHFNSPNDLVVRTDGNVYFTDPDWQLGGRASETGMRGFYRVSPAGEVTLVDGGFDEPNGVTLSPDEQTLYAGGRSGGIQRYAVDAAGTPSPRVPFAPGSTDGMTVDCAGNVYATNGDVVVFDPSGAELGRITVPATPSNVAFGGAARQTLFITAGSALYAIDMAVPGLPY